MDPELGLSPDLVQEVVEGDIARSDLDVVAAGGDAAGTNVHLVAVAQLGDDDGEWSVSEGDRRRAAAGSRLCGVRHGADPDSSGGGGSPGRASPRCRHPVTEWGESWGVSGARDGWHGADGDG